MMTHTANRFDLRRCVPMERAEEELCATEYKKTRSPLLAQRLILANLRLVVTIAKRYRHSDCDLRDLVQEGSLGLMQAVSRYEPDRGVKLCSYAAWWIRAYILKYAIGSWRLVKTGTTQAQRRLFFRLQRERGKIEALGQRPDTKQLASTLHVKEKDVVSMIERFSGGDTSLDAPCRTGDDAGTRTVGDTLSADAALQPDRRVEASQFDRALAGKLRTFERTLRGRDLTIYQRRLLCEEPETLSELAARFGVSRERVRQVEDRLKGRIRHFLTDELPGAVEPNRATA